MSEGDVALACARVFVGSLAAFGLTDACVSPGSRSTPLALALDREDRIRVHVHLDERSSGFFALGLAKASGRPVAVACTSGTAATNLFPAIVEASTSRTPLIALTADRPPELRGVGANQTIDQIALYGRYVRWFIDAPVPSAGPDASRTWFEMAAEVYRNACAPGPVHVNLPYREPLVPSGEPVDLGDVTIALGHMEPSVGPSVTDEDVSGFLDSIGDARRGLVYAGGLRVPSPAILELARRLGWPAIAEPTSGCRAPGALSAGQLLLGDETFASGHAPEIVVQFGAAPTSRAGLSLVREVERLVVVDPDDVVADPSRRAKHRFVVEADRLAAAATDRVQIESADAWREEWETVDARVRRAVDELLDGLDEPFEGRVARDLAAGLPAGATLLVGSSMPVRDLDAFMAPRDGVRVLANRGASGIDGFVSTALGVAATGTPTFALLGDLTLLHDVGSLLWSARRGLDAVLVVVNNDGGGIFPLLEQRDLPELVPLFVTPHGLDLGAICFAAGAGHVRVRRASELVPAVERAAASGGVRIAEVLVDRERNIARRSEVRAAVERVLRSR